VALQGLPKLYAPSVRGDIGGKVRFRALLSEELPWTVTVSDSSANIVATGSGTSQEIDWTWDSANVAKGLYNWTIVAGDTVRPASGTIGAVPVALAVKSVTAVPRTITPNGDGQSDSSQVSYTLSAPATVTATLQAQDGRQLAVLFSEARRPGKQSFEFTASGIPDGLYEILLSATAGKATVSATVPVLVDRTVRRFAAAPLAISPNGDGVQDDLVFTFELTRAASVHIALAQAGKTVVPIFDGDLRPGTQSVGWGGTGVKDGKYAGVLTATNDIGAVTHTALFRVDTVAPVLRALSFRSLRFRISEAATIRLTVNGRQATHFVRAGVFSFHARGVRTVRIVAQDMAGNVSRTLRFP
jgi:hypothetical protein